MTRFYFHGAIHPDAANMPQTNQHTLTPTSGKVFDSFTANRTMDGNTGSNDTGASITTNASTSQQTLYFHRFVSLPLNLNSDGGISAQTWTYNFAAWETNSSTNFPVTSNNKTMPINCYVWRPRTQQKIASILQGNSNAEFDEITAGGSQARVVHGTFAGSAVAAGSLENGDVIIFEVWAQITQGSATAYTVQWWMDGNTVNTTPNTAVSNHASFLETPQTLSEFTPRNLEANIGTQNLTLTEARTRLRNKTKVHGSILDSDNFDAGTYSFTEGGTSPNGKWTNSYLGGTGATSGVRLNSAIGNNVMYEKPQTSTAEFETHATLNMHGTTYSDFDLYVDLRTVQQLRQNFTPNAWETAWILFRFTDNYHHYYLVLKTSGIELGRKDYGTPQEQQIFLVTNGTPFTTVGNWENVRLRAIKNRITVWVNGVLAFDFLDDGSVGYDTATGGLPAPPSVAMYSGKIGLYTEDAEVEFNNFIVAETNVINLADTRTKIEGKTKLRTDSITLTHTSTNKLRNKIRLRADTLTLVHTSTNRLKNITRLRTDSLTLTHTSTNRLRMLIQLRSDALTLVHTSTAALRMLIQLRADTLTLAHASTSAFRMLIQLNSDSFTLADARSRLQNKVRTFTNSLTLVESIVYDIKARVKAFTNSLTLTDVNSRLRTRNKSIDSQNIGFSLDSIVKAILLRVRAFTTDSLAFTESISFDKPRGLVVKILGNVLGSDDFESGTYSFTEGGLSPNSKWDNQYMGGTGSSSGVRFNSDIGDNVMWERPQVSTAEFETHATFNLFVESQFSDFDVTVDMRTVERLRQNFPPNTWETAWIIFRYTDNWHHYYLVLKTNGIELGRKDYATQIEQQIFLVTNATPFTTIGEWAKVRIRAVKNRFTVWVDDEFAFDFLDDGSVGYDSNTGGLPAPPTAAMYSGYIGLYNEDAEVEFNNFFVGEIPMLILSDSVNALKVKLKSLPNQSLTLNLDSINRIRNIQRSLSESPLSLSAPFHTLTGRLRLLTTQTFSLADSLFRLANRNREFVEAIGFADSSLRGFVLKVRDFAVSLSFTSIKDRLTTRIRTLDDLNITFTEDMGFGGALVRVISHVLGLDKTITRLKAINRESSDDITLEQPEISRLRSKITGFDESLTFDEYLNQLKLLLKGFTDSIGLNMSGFDTMRARLVAFSESISLTDLAARLKGLKVKTISDSIGPFNVDSVLTAKGIGRGIVSSLSLFAENVTHSKLLRVRALASQNLGLSHLNSRIRSRIKSMSTQNIGLSDIGQKSRSKIRGFIQSLTFTDVVNGAKEVVLGGFVDSINFVSSVAKSTPARVKDFTDNIVLSGSTVIQDIVSRVVEPIISTLGEKVKRPELYISVNPVSLYRRIIERDAHPLIQKKDLDIDKPVKHPDIPGSTPEIKAENKMDEDVKTKLNRGKKIGRLF